MIKKFMILGDSYSTYAGCIPEGYATYYSPEGDPNSDHTVRKMQQCDTWWQRLIDTTGAELLLNNSWSGSTVSYTGRSADCSRTSSYIYRYRQLRENGFFANNDIDTIFVFGGTNDSWINVPLGEVMLSDWQESDLYNVLPAICHLMYSLKHDLPSARVIFIANCDIKQEIVDCIKHAAEHYGAEVVELCGIDKQFGHPTPLGMSQICDQVIACLNK